MCKAYGGEPSVDLLRSFLNLGRAGDWLTLSNRGGADVPKALMKPVQRPRGNKSQKACDLSSWTGYTFVCLFNFLPEGGLDENQGSLSAKSMNNETPMIDVEPISDVHPSNVAENIVDSYNTSPEEDELSPVGPSASPYPEAGEKSKAARKRKLTVDAPRECFHKRAWNVPAQASKVAGDASTPLDVDSDPDIHEFPYARELKNATDYHWVVAHVTPPSWKPYLREISIEQLYDIHDRAYIRQVVLDKMLNNKTPELISALHKARASCDAIREREIQKDKAYAELEKKCNEALQDLDKNPFVSDTRAEIETLQGQVSGLHNEYSRLVLEQKKWVNYEQTLLSHPQMGPGRNTCPGHEVIIKITQDQGNGH
ncbi:hypothetical protein Tco_0875473 [Tanacetum coccineum]|uniref:Uncharacterized protein n=1 Tax=Tanacetum coccineum TaxID=301880 RepID=A0ABQ5BSF4_9ASTR